jgi:hypothetical protein
MVEFSASASGDIRQYTPLTPHEIIDYFAQARDRILALEQKLADIISENNLKVPTKMARKPVKHRARVGKASHDDVAEDKAMINKAMAKHVHKAHPGDTPTEIKRGGRAKAPKRKR